jgi:peptidoglycan/LPS O-acetylase OafA/YrhL/glycosyltransferase involved in cell wall biosynthesis
VRIAIFDYRIIRTNPIGGCHLRSIQGLSGDHKFTVFAVEFENPDPARVEWVRIPVPTRPLALLFVLFHILAPIWYIAYRLRKRVKFDLIQIVECNLSFGTVAYSQFCHRAYLRNHWKRSRPKGLRGVLRLLDHVLHAAMEPLVYRRVQLIIVPSAGLARELSTVYPRLTGKLRVLANPVDVEKLQMPVQFDRHEARQKLKIRSNGEVLLVFAALGQFERKGLPVILEALRQLNDPRIKLQVVGGEPDLVRSYEKRVRQMGLGGVVAFAGSQRDVRPYLWAADAFVLPSFYETFSLVSFEAAAAGLPLIVAPLHGVEDLMRSDDCGFVVEPTPNAVAAAIFRFAALNDRERMTLGSTAKRSAAQYSTGNFVQRWREVYSSTATVDMFRPRTVRSSFMTQKLPPVRLTTSPESRPGLPPLTGLRAAAALWVVLFHFGPAFGLLVPATLALSRFTTEGFYGVDLFFVLSGFILTYNYYGRRFTYGEFIGNRLARIYPVHLFTLLVLAAMMGVAGAAHSAVTAHYYGLREFVLNLALIQSWGLTDGKSWNYPSWSLSAEWFAYVLVFPVAALLLKNVTRRMVLALLIAGSIITYSILCPEHAFGGISPLIQVTLEFFAGCCLCRLRDLWRISETAATRTVNASVLLLAGATWLSTSGRINPGIILLFAVFIFGLSRSRGAMARALGSRWAVYFGETSFALYMTHGLFQKVVSAVAGPERFESAPLALRCWVVVLCMALMLLIASGVYHLVEVPARSRVRKMMRQRGKVATAVASSI